MIDFLIFGVVALIVVFAAITVEEVGSTELAEQICEEYESQGSADTCVFADTTVFVFAGDVTDNVVIASLVVAALNLVLLAWLTGGSLGKLMVGIRVVDKATFEKAGFLKHLLRWVLMIVDTFPWFLLVPLTGLILGIVSKGHRRVGDFAASTLVVNKSYVGKPTLVPGVNDGLVQTDSSYWAPPVHLPPPESPPPPPPPLSSAPSSAEATTSAPNHEPIPEQASEPGTEPSQTAETTETDEATEVVETAEVTNEVADLQPGLEAPMWDEARDTYIQWDPKIEAWMEWSKSENRWIPISQ